MSTTFDTFTQRHPAAIRRLLTLAHLYVMTLPAATIAAALTGHTVATLIGIFALIGCYPTGYATAAHRYTQRSRDLVAQARRDPLTGLPNRAVADQILTDATDAGRHDEQYPRHND